MRRFSLWLRGKPVVADSIMAFALMMLDMTGIANSTNKVVYLLVALSLPIPVAFRRVSPRIMAALTLLFSYGTTVLGWALNDKTTHAGLLALGIMLYTLVAYVGRRDGMLFVLGLVLDTVISIVLLHQPVWETFGILVLLYALCWTLAEFNGARHAYDAEVTARLAVADYDRERRAHDAVAAERTRIARELHDVVAHAVSVMIVQADGAKYALRQNPDAAEQALTTIAATGRDALRELRRTVALLRTEHAPEQLPQHGTAGLARVVEMMRGTGLAVELELTGELDDISPEISLGVHRIVQESLTNTLRHAGAHPMAWVRVRRTETDVLIEITDSGGEPVHAGQANRITGSGLGLVGMRERMAVLGGTLEAGRTGDGAWRVSATIPLAPEHRE
ncbi:sensor histidine kinase [Nocardia sp. NPDC052566]|uniref:sensor histidine kinase n=1 Tax=Nocardia sp. NPDC052566 TaxID=3364330 RepID=UPI0037C814AD